MKTYQYGEVVKISTGVFGLFCRWSLDLANESLHSYDEYPYLPCSSQNCLCGEAGAELYKAIIEQPSKEEAQEFWNQEDSLMMAL